MPLNERSPFGGTLLRVLQAALPLQHCPAAEIVLGQLAEDRFEIDLPIAQGTEPARTLHPALVAAVHTGPGIGAELGIFDVEHTDARVVAIDETQVIHLLQQQVTGVVEDGCPRMVIDRFQETLERGPIVKVLAGMDFVAQVHPGRLETIENRQPAPGQLGKHLFDKPARALWPRVHVGPQQRAGKRRMGTEPQALTGPGRQLELLDGPLGPGLGLAAQMGRSEVVEQRVERRVYRDQLALQVRRQFADLDAGLCAGGLDLIAVGLAVGGPGQVDVTCAQGRQLNGFVPL